jgi:two-component system cell cycle response regulator DivK
MRAVKLVLLVDDDPDTWYVYSRVLGHAGYDAIAARNGVEGLERARTMQPDLILMDYRLPLMNGWDVVRALKADESTRRIPVVALTAYDMRDGGAAARDAGCEEFLTKPVDPFDILHTVVRWIGAPEARAPDATRQLGEKRVPSLPTSDLSRARDVETRE